jgi:hypothetical protein
VVKIRLLALLFVVAACSGEEDPVGKDAVIPDDTGDPGDDTGDPGDDTGDPGDDTGDPGNDDKLVESTSAFVYITAPNYGYAMSTELDVVTLEGVAREDVVEVSWEGEGGASGTADGTLTWSIADLPLIEGDNTLTVTGTNADGDTGSTQMRVVYTPGVPFESGLTLSQDVAFLDTPAEISASLWLSAEDTPDTVELASVDSSGQAIAVLTNLEAGEEPGFYVGSFTVDESQAQTWELRGIAVFGGDEGATPPVSLEIRALQGEAEFQSMLDLSSDIAAVYSAADPDNDPEGARDAAIAALMAESEVQHVGTNTNGSLGLWWVVDGIGFVIRNPTDGIRGGGAASAGEYPRAYFPSSGPGTPRGWTQTSRGISGRSPRVLWRNPSGSTNVVGSNKGRTIAAFNDEFSPSDESPDLEFDMNNHACPKMEVPSTAYDESADLATFSASFGAGLLHISTHGDHTIAGLGTNVGDPYAEGEVMIYTREYATAESMVAYAADLNSGNLIVDGVDYPYAFTPGWVQAQTAANPMPNSIVGMSACMSAFDNTMASAFLAGGAGYYFGFTNYVNSSYAYERSYKFWEEIFDQEPTATAYGEMRSPWEPDESIEDPAYPDGWGDADLYLGMGEISNGDFESGTDDWSEWGDSSLQVAASLPGASSVQPPEGSGMAYASIQAAGSNYHEFGHEYCPVESSTPTVTFQWQVVTDDWSDCSTGVPNWLNLRIDSAQGNVEHWFVEWTDVCPLLTNIEGIYKGTGWQEATVQLPAIGTNTANELTFSVGGWNYDEWIGLVDNITLEE